MKISFLKKSSKNSQKIQRYRSWSGDSKNMTRLGWQRNIFEIFGAKYEFFGIFKNDDIAMADSRKTLRVIEEQSRG